ncbi:DUF742 domain-containing protein [Streptomyces gardneri]|uniref:DUF742 domain-containing protein n=1 Tax=Nocardia TaxID=1817 RepID=UPI001894CF0E|nr:DUF742 domain-containing protein [Nocardia abscessus]MBF6166983.1 DUF742 domain-containing protein [Streptomyces gardneri]MBF6221729.1 DUF742 domain-containing protein [Nocardia abscessus]MBF6475326.1 DUF742 domain-containing protein [Nocardia abscessus]
MSRSRDPWYDDEAGPLVRLYTVTRGRTEGAPYELDMLTLVITASIDIQPRRRTEPEYTRILQISRTAQSVAELAAQLDLPLSTTKILVGDLIDEGLLLFRSPDPAPESAAQNTQLLRAILKGIQAI